MARIFPAVCPATKGDVAVAPGERQFFARLTRELDAGWQIIHDCEMRPGDEPAVLDFVLVHRDYGIALLGIAAPGKTDDPARAVAAMRRTLNEIGFAERYRGHPAIVARTIVPEAVSDLAAFLAVRFAAVPASAIGDPTWADWLRQRLVPERAAAAPAPVRMTPEGAPHGLRAPAHEEAWRVLPGDRSRASAGGSASPRGGTVGPSVRVTPERIAVSRDAETRSPLWAGMALAVFVVAIVLVGMAVLSHGNGSDRLLAAKSAAPPVSPTPVIVMPAAE